MVYRYLFNTAGKYVAFISGNNVFTPESKWFGYVVNGNEFYGANGYFIGYILDDDRVVRNKQEFPRIPHIPRIPPIPPIPPLPPLPRLPKFPLPYPYEDVFK